MKTVVLLFFSVLVSSTYNSNPDIVLPTQITKKWVIKDAQIGEKVKHFHQEEGDILEINSDTHYYLNDKKRGSWTFLQGKESIMFINGEFDGLWDIKEMNEDYLEILMVENGQENVASRKIKLKLEATTAFSPTDSQPK